MEGGLYTIGEAARLTDLPIKTIRYYADIGLLPPAETTASRYRLYSAAELWRLELIRTLRQMDFSLADIRRVMAGELSIAVALDLHLKALAVQIDHLARIKDVLVQARARIGDGDASLEGLHALGQALLRGDEERRRFLTGAVRTLLVDESAPVEWQERMVQGFRDRLPDDLTPDQQAALVELQEVLNDPDAVAALRDEMAPFWQMVRTYAVDPAWWGETMQAIGARAIEARRSGERADGSVVQALVDEWAALCATAMRQPVTDDFVRELAAQAPNWGSGRSQRLTDMLRRLGPPETQHDWPRAQQLLLDGLAWRVAQMDDR